MYSTGETAHYAALGTQADLGSVLLSLLAAPEIVPGSAPSYQLCKTIYSYHPLGAILADAPVTRAQAKPRTLSVPILGEKRFIEQFKIAWNAFGKIGATAVIHNLMSMSRVYGIASLGVGERGKDTDKPLDFNDVANADLYLSVLDPLNTAGSLVLNQDPNSPEYLKPSGDVRVNGKRWDKSRLFIKMHEQPLYIEWTDSAFGFVGRSVYQRALYPMKTFIQSMITDQLVTQKAGLLVYKATAPGSFINNIMQQIMGMKRGAIKTGVTGQVVSIGLDEAVETLNMQNLDKAASFARTNVLKNIASAAGMPASIIAQETLTEGFGEGSEDAKKEVQYLDFLRTDMDPVYAFVDRLVMRQAWTPAFFERLAREYPEYAKIPFETALYSAISAFSASWPNLLIEPESEKSKTADVKFKAVVALLETLGPVLDPANRAALVGWVADNANEAGELFSSKLIIDQDALEEYILEQEAAAAMPAEEEEEPVEPRPFARSA